MIGLWLSLLLAAATGAQLLQEGAALNRAGQFDKAVPVLQRAVAARAGSAAYLELSIAFARLHRFAEADAALKHVPEPQAVAERLVFYRLRASIALALGDAVGSAVSMKAALALAPENAQLREATAVAELQAADALEKKGDSVPAIRYYQAALQHAPEREQYHLALGIELLRHYNFDTAIPVFENAVHAFPQSVKAKVGLAIAYRVVDRQDDAVRVLMEAASGPDPGVPLLYLGEMEIKSSAAPHADAVDAVCAVGNAGSDPHMKALCGALRVKMAPDEAAGESTMAMLRTATRQAPDDAVGRCWLGRAYEQRSDWSAARVEYEACAKLDAGSPESHYRLARVYRRLGMNAEAKDQDALRASAEKNQASENERRIDAVRRFVMTDEPVRR